MRARIYATMLSLLVAGGCDKPAEEKAPTTTAATTGEPSVDELLGKLPKAQPPKGPAPVAEAPQVQVVGKFSGNASLPTSGEPKPFQLDPKAVDELNIVGPPRIESAFLERTLGPEASVIVHLGGAENDGLMLTVRHAGRSASRPIPPANNGPELVSNLDHTLDRVLDELGIPRR